MIEINLLPGEFRQVEGTPPARLGAILGGVAVACVLGFFVTKYFLIDIPAMKVEINNRKTEIVKLTERKKEVEKVIAAIDTLKKKVATLDNLIQSRVRFARLLEVLASAMPPEGVWFRSFSIQPLQQVAPTMGTAGGKRFQINLQGYTTGPSEQIRGDRMTDLQKNINRVFVEQGVDPKTGIHEFLGLKFSEARMVTYAEINSLPDFKEPKDMPKEQAVQLLRVLSPQLTKQARDFSMTLSFELPPPVEEAPAAAPGKAAPKK